ncbi:MAG TPA: hypothetical protein VG073_00725 [Gaiellaceae bacterium]|nr:hypothetical protein [Gaiellaceae bacterium]
MVGEVDVDPEGQSLDQALIALLGLMCERQLPLREVGLVTGGAAHDPSVLQERGAQNAEGDEQGKVAGVGKNRLTEHNPGYQRADHPRDDATYDGGRADSREEDETWQMKMMRIELRREEQRKRNREGQPDRQAHAARRGRNPPDRAQPAMQTRHRGLDSDDDHLPPARTLTPPSARVARIDRSRFAEPCFERRLNV